ncbi:uncharacterized protein LOC109858918 isoform X2 [Pseudomyrmex gracilis]|uniref:uncharacterized protein LOC109858918 isoform X2 n=1 Tax=Pseudomyrmex gracilis TaxID=219809 RepID=UPI00099591D8|nr:uncharacterized protein LOC109858918 isoform X2 [Pseudomyrmex gracilis]XP_020292222.1 uncharacterized protein LOC109858918 isoform X2 [Pseudomyrmex gracilis]
MNYFIITKKRDANVTYGKVSSRLCDGGHVCSHPKECCPLGCCYSLFTPMHLHISEMFNFLIWTYWYLWVAVLVALAIAAICGFWLWKRHRSSLSEDCTSSERTSTGPWYPPPHYSRCSSFVQALPPPYNEVTAKPDLYPLVIGYEDSSGKGTSGFVMRYFRSLSHASTLDSLSSSFMYNMVNEANTIIPPPYSCNNSVDGLSATECERRETGDMSSVVSLANHRTTSDISSLAAQSPCSPPRATSPTIELRELLDKIQQLPHLSAGHTTIKHCQQTQAPVLYVTNGGSTTQQRSLSPSDVGSYKIRRTRGKLYMPLGLPSSRSKPKRWLSRSAPTTPSGAIPMPFLPIQNRKPSEVDTNNQQVVPLLSEQDENENNNAERIPSSVSVFAEQEEDREST